MNESENNNLPTLEDAFNVPVEEITKIAIPVLSEVIDNQELQDTLFSNLDLPDDLRQQLAERVTLMVQQKLSEALPIIMQQIERDISQTIQQHITDRLPEIISEALKRPTT